MPKWIRALPHQRMVLLVGLFAALNFMDYSSIPGGDAFRDGKIRYLFLLAAPMAFRAIYPYLTFGPAAFAAMAVASFTLHDYRLYATFPLLVILAVMAGAIAVVRQGKEFLAKLLVAGGAFQAAVALLQVGGVHIFFEPLIIEDLHTPVGLWGHETALGPFLVAALCPALWRKQWWAAVPIASAALATSSSMTLAALGAAVAIYSWHLYGWRAPAFLTVLGATGLAGAYIVAPKLGLLNINGRGVIWRYGWQAFLERPLMGHGIGSWAGEVISRYVGRYAVELRTLPRQLHCDPLDFLVEYGLLGALPLAGAAGHFLRHFRPSWTHAVCVAILVNSLANFPLCLPPIAVVFVACWAFLTRDDTMGECEMHAGMRSFC